MERRKIIDEKKDHQLKTPKRSVQREELISFFTFSLMGLGTIIATTLAILYSKEQVGTLILEYWPSLLIMLIFLFFILINLKLMVIDIDE